jgi:hypothetical protein
VNCKFGILITLEATSISFRKRIHTKAYAKLCNLSSHNKDYPGNRDLSSLNAKLNASYATFP